MRLSTSNLNPRRVIVLVTIAGSFAPVGAAGAQHAKPLASFSKSAHSLRDSIVQIARAQLGKRYKYGGESPEKGFDCSGLVTYIMTTLKLDVPRTAQEQATKGVRLRKDTSALLPGDLLTFGKPAKGVSHVGIYVGDGRYIHASSVAGKVIESDIDRPVSPLVRGWRGARRILSPDTANAGDSVGRSLSKSGVH